MSAPRILLSATTALALAGAAPTASAQSVSFGDIDINGDNVLTMDELVAAFGESTALDMLRLYDRDGSGSVALSEARAVSREGATNAAAGMRRADANRAAAELRREAARERAEVARAAQGRPDFAGAPSGGDGPGRGSSASSSAGSMGEDRGAGGSDRSEGRGRP